MKIIDVYTPFTEALQQHRSIEKALQATKMLSPFGKRATDWGADWRDIQDWMLSPNYSEHARKSAHCYLPLAKSLVERVEETFGTQELPGELHLIPSCAAFDGFARYDHGHHTVLLGIDFPDADLNYLKALTAHELSHVYRDHQPDVWGFLGKPLSDVSRNEYLEASNAREHLASEGLATLFSQLLFPEIAAGTHHYYEAHEWEWCLDHHNEIDVALQRCLKDPRDEDVWRFYGEGEVSPGSPSRTHYYWASHQIREWLPDFKLRSLIIAHGWHADRFDCFSP